MKKIKLALLLMIFFGSTSVAQTPFYDAVKLKNDFLTGQDTVMNGDSVFILLSDIDEVYGILKNYVPEGVATKDQIAAEFNSNPFMRFNRNRAHSALSVTASSSDFLKSIGGLDVTKFANAIADILIERAKQELTIAFFDRFKKFAKNYPEFQLLFPVTYDNLNNLLSYTYPQMLPALRDGFFQDIGQIPYHLEALLELPKYRTLLVNFPEVGIAIRSIRLIHRLEDGEINAAEVIREFSQFKEWSQSGSLAFSNMSATIKMASIFSEALRNKDRAKIWVSSQEALSLVNDENLTKIFLGLLWQQIKNAGIVYHFDSADPANVVELATLVARQRDNIMLVQNKISQFIGLADDVNKSYADISRIGVSNISKEDWFNYINVSINVVDFSFSVVKLFDDRLKADDYLDIARKANLLYKNIYSKQYTEAVNNSLELVMKVHDLAKKPLGSVTNSNVPGALPYKDASDKLENFIKKVRPYAIFMANMLEAKDEAEVKAALENAILPVGSSSIKKNTWCNVSVQTYLGAYWSTSSGSSSSGNAWSDKFGVIAPIGISWTPGFLSWQKRGAISLFGSLFDLGAIVDYKLKKDSTVNNAGATTEVVSKDYKIKLGQIVSPGVYAVYGFPANLPLSLGFGGQYGPGLSKIDAGNNTVVGNPSWRWNLFLAVDIPFFTLKNKTRNK